MRMGHDGHAGPPLNLPGHPCWSKYYLQAYGRNMLLRQRTAKEHDAHTHEHHKRLLWCQTATVNVAGPPRGGPVTVLPPWAITLLQAADWSDRLLLLLLP